MTNSLEISETRDYIGLDENPVREEELEKVLSSADLAAAHISGVLSQEDLGRFKWERSVLGELDLDKDRAVTKGIRYVPFKEVEDLWMASATIGIPKREAARMAYAVAEKMQSFVQAGELTQLEALIASVTERAFRTLLEHYQIPPEETEAFFDDNATMALYQALPTLGIPPGSTILTFYDTGRVIPEALSGTNPELMPFNFRPNIDIWQNRKNQDSREGNIGPYKLHLVEHYKDDSYLCNQEILAEILEVLERDRPALFVLPTVTRLGRRLSFIELSIAIRKRAQELGYDPMIILDDAQGLSRLTPNQYTHEKFRARAHAHRVPSIWNYADGILLTGAKVTGALMGSGALLLNAARYQEKQAVDFKDSPLAYRARRYAFHSSNTDRMDDYNRAAPGMVHTPELLSLAVAVDSLPLETEVFKGLRDLREQIVRVFKSKKGVTVLEKARGEVGFIDSIIAFYLNHLPRDGGTLKRELANHVPPITLPALVDADERHYLRIALDPTRMKEADYPEKVEQVVHEIERAIEGILEAK